MKILVIAEHDNDHLKPVTANTVTAAATLGQKAGGAEIHVLVAGQGAQAAAAAAAQLAGVSCVHVAEAPHLQHQVAEAVSAQVISMCAGFDAIVLPATAFGKNISPRIAARLDVSQISDVIEIESADTFKRPIYAGNVIATVQSTDKVKVMTVRGTSFEAAGSQAPAPVEPAVAAAAPAKSAKFESREIAKLERPELTAAKVVISGGRALASKENFAMLEKLADVLGAAMGASRAAVDAGYAPNDWQVGQTGKVVAPQLYIAVGISGAIQHLAGMKDSKVIVAINQDPEAPIFQVADYGLVGDLFQAVPELTEALSKG
ncbi:MAG: electron transfer flavoprotein subunit alpha/FixB family protein [Burkholderiaceae bacterium]|nr:electron transfer flavoprotein subunit alpha/FixB family protein [Burkholderiaceae bacterium]